MCIFHKWRRLYKDGKKHCLGEEYVSEDYTEYEICTKCDTIIRFLYDSQGGSRYGIEDEEEKIIRKQIKLGRLK